jgi:hypothetical protein
MNNILEKYRNEFQSSENDAYLKSLCNVGAKLLLNAIQAEYDKLCPRVEEFEKRGATHCWSLYPTNSNDSVQFIRFNKGDNNIGTEDYIDKIPLGLDFRLCRWSIDDAKRIWGEE